ncbi:MAG: NAD(P)-binding domain-containing protein, partial [Bacteroidota bacterium]|nr:NAD(P)-binding domain-containing protein [Bacteroidota bacterium]
MSTKRLKIVFLGAGNVATHLSKALQKAGHHILQIYSRTEKSAKELAMQLNVPY